MKKQKDIISLFKEYLNEENITAYNEATKSGIVKHIVVREHAESFILTVVVTDEKFNNFSPLIKKLSTKFKSFGIVKNVNKLSNNVIFGKRDEFIYGLKELKMQEFEISYQVNNRSFLQVNNEVKNKIYSKIISEINYAKNVCDAYSGAGLLSAIVAKNAENVYGIEIITEANINAEELKTNDWNLNTNICGDCSKVLPTLAKQLKSDFSLILDPPRKGVDKVVCDAIIASEPKQIIYLSCNPATLARDLDLLKEKYEIRVCSAIRYVPTNCKHRNISKIKFKESLMEEIKKTQNKPHYQDKDGL